MRNCPAGRTYRFGLIVAAMFAVGFCGSQASAATYYIRVSGDDSNDGLAPITAFQTMVKASTVVTSGDMVYVGAGTYTDLVIFDGIQQSTDPLTFIADTMGTFTGDAGPVIISNGTVGVVNCNYIGFHGFQFQGATDRFIVWKGSYGGLFKDCIFDGGSEPLLIKDGSVTFENCQLTDFTTDAIYVDGEALVQLVNSSISGCQEEGIEIAKTARVVLDGTTIENNVGDGIKVAQTDTYIDDGGIGASGGVIERLVAGKTRIIATGGMFDGYDSSLGAYGPGNNSDNADLYANIEISAGAAVPVQGSVYYAPGGSATVPNLTGSINQMPAAIAMDPIDPGDAATNNDNLSIPLTDLGNNAYSGGRLIVGTGDGLDLPPGTYYFVDIFLTSCTVRISGPTTVYVTGRAYFTGGNVTTDSGKPSDFKLNVMGTPVQLSGSSSVTGAIYSPNSKISLSGTSHIYGMAVGNEIIMSDGGIHADKALTTYAAEVQGLPMGSSSPSPPPEWSALTAGEIEVGDSTIQSNRRGVNIETAQAFTASDADFLNNTEWGLCLNGPFELDTCSMTGNGIGGIWLKGVNDGEFSYTKLTIGDNPEYGMYLEDCQVTFDGFMLDQYTFTSGSNYIIFIEGGSMTLDGVTITGGTEAGVYATAGALTVKNSTVSGSGYGIGADQSTVVVEGGTLTGNTTGLYGFKNATLTVTGATLSNNTDWGAAVSLTDMIGATTAFPGTTFSGNGAGIALVDAVGGTVEFPNTVIENNTNDGIRFTGCNLTLDATATAGLQITNNNCGINSVNSTLTLDGLTLSGNLAAAVYAVGGNLSVSNSTLSSGGYGVSVSSSGTVSINTCSLSGTSAALNADQNADVTVVNSNFTGSPYGLWATNNTQLDVDSSTFNGNSLYGVYLGGNGSLHNCTITSNTSGLYLNTANVTDAQLTGTDIAGNSTYGVYVYNGSLTLNSQATDDWSIDGNGYNIASYGADISLTSVNITNATNYGVRAEYGSLSLQQSTITSNLDGVCGVNTNLFTIDRSHISGTNTGGSGVANLDGGLVMRNTVVSGAETGVYSSGPSKPVTIYNSTIADASLNGLYVYDGDLTVMNTIISGTGGTYGLYRGATASVAHSYNLVSGFAVAFESTIADSTELLDLPRFADAANGDFSLAKGSPAINSGADLSISHTVDLLGNTRPSHKVFEIGAYEYIQDGGSLRVLKWKEER